jgi:hypothetical protein
MFPAVDGANNFEFAWQTGGINHYLNGGWQGGLVRSQSSSGWWQIVDMEGNSASSVMAVNFVGASAQFGISFASDRRFKSNIGPVTIDALGIINALRVYAADLTPPFPDAKPQHWHCSLIADEVEPLLPSAYIPPPVRSPNSQSEPYAMLRELPLIATLVKAVQQLTAKVEALEQQLS